MWVLMPDNKGLNYMVATTCKWENNRSTWQIKSAKNLQQWEERVGNERQCKFVAMQMKCKYYKRLALADN